MNASAAHPLSRRMLLAALAAVGVGAVVAFVGWQRARDQWFASYLLAWQYWAGFSLGSLSVLLLHNITGGAWGEPVRPALRAAIATLPLVALLFLPVALRPQEIYEWADPYHVGEDPILAHKARYLNVDAFRIRAAIYFGLWFLLQLLVAWQRRRTFVRGERAERRLRRWSGQGLALHGLALTFAAVDWIMSLEPHWFSAIFGVIWFASHGLAALALGIAMASTSAEMRAAGPQDPGRDALYDLGKLLLAFVMFWAYVSFSQFFIIWSGNLPEEVVWYAKRFEGGWGDLALALVALHFVAPLVLLLGRDFKREPRLLGPLAVGLVVVHWLDALWQVGPTASDRRIWLDAGLTLGVGGLW
ncbi:MAG TPA: hypothetical protein VEQ85_07085, partial [Lacipirellulaceae bacterium]|nr:hypothetical protein [Lacipirellulaceae bacterium]